MLYPRALMVTHQGCPQTPGRRRGPIPAMCQYQGSPVSSIAGITPAELVSPMPTGRRCPCERLRARNPRGR